MKDKVNLYTDGACAGNPGPGGWGAVLQCGKYRRELSGGDKMTTNNRMELSAVIEGLGALKRPCEVNIYTDSKYVSDAVNKKWVYGWKKRGWKNSNKDNTPNIDLWERLLVLLEMHSVTFIWIKGHNGHHENELCDRMAVDMSQKYK